MQRMMTFVYTFSFSVFRSHHITMFM